MYKLYTDKVENFECSLKLEGTTVSKSTCRLILESPELNLLFHGDISTDGTARIPIKKLRGVLPEGTQGVLKLEVIADHDVYFAPWEDSFEIVTDKKITVESVKSQTPTQSRPSVTVINTNIVKQFATFLNENKITIANLKANKAKLQPLLESYVAKHHVTVVDQQYLIDNIQSCTLHMK